MSEIYIALVHHPIRNKNGEIVTTSVTNLDVHDISRSARSFGMSGYFIVTPVKAQHKLLERILDHWRQDPSYEYNPDRQDALTQVLLVDSIDQAKSQIEQKHGVAPMVAVTGANFETQDGSCSDLMSKLKLDGRPMLLLFGTGWGLTASVIEQADYRLGPIRGAANDNYNHLSVRSAVAIYCDRLRGSL